MRIGRHLWSLALTGGLFIAGPVGLAHWLPGGARPARAETAEVLVHTSEETQFMELANRERSRRGLRQLTVEPLLIAVARQHSREMMEKDYFDHHSPTPGLKTPMERYLKFLGFRPKYACVGENLYYATLADVKRGHRAFMNSPTHRENVLFPRFERIGVGIHKNDKGEFWVTQMYLTNAPE